MFIDLNVSSSFPSTGRTIAHQLQLQPGLTAVTGANEAGKTFTSIEMPRYLLFGTKALRGTLADYNQINCSGTVRIKGRVYTIDRNPKTETLTDDTGEVLAVGADAVNKKIVSLLGYGLDVFDIANVCRQGDVEALTKMTPGDRKAMIDRVVGLDKVEAIERECRTEANALVREVEALLTALPPEPVAPVPYADYAPSMELAEELEELRTRDKRRAALLATAAVGAPPPAPASAGPSLASCEARVAAQADRQALLQALDALPPALYTVEQLDAAEAWLDQFERGPRPRYTEAELDAADRYWADGRRLSEVVECPNCQHEFCPSALDIDAKAHLDAPIPPVTAKEIAAERVAIARWVGHVPIETAPEPTLTRPEIARARHALTCAAERAEYEAALAQTVDDPTAKEDLAQAQLYERALATYVALFAEYEARVAAAAEAQKEADEIGDLSAIITQTAARHAEAVQYERDLQTFHAADLEYRRIYGEIETRRAAAAGFTAGSKALKELRAEFKSHLAPAIGAVASRLLSAMTGGARNTIEVSGDFDVLVDNQPVRTLSGSGAAVTNLALRLGLGQVLTNKVFPVFLGDEIDTTMDAERAGFTAEAMRALSDTLDQVVLVTHKDTEADQTISL